MHTPQGLQAMGHVAVAAEKSAKQLRREYESVTSSAKDAK